MKEVFIDIVSGFIAGMVVGLLIIAPYIYTRKYIDEKVKNFDYGAKIDSLEMVISNFEKRDSSLVNKVNDHEIQLQDALKRIKNAEWCISDINSVLVDYD